MYRPISSIRKAMILRQVARKINALTEYRKSPAFRRMKRLRVKRK